MVPAATVSIANEFMVLAVTTPGTMQAPGTITAPYISALTLNQGRILGDQSLPHSSNLMSEMVVPPTLLGDTPPVGGVAVQINATALRVANITVLGGEPEATVAFEEWLLVLDGPSLSFAVSRTFVANGSAAADRFPALAMQTSQGGYSAGADYAHRQGPGPRSGWGASSDAIPPAPPTPPAPPAPPAPPTSPAVPTDWRLKVQMPMWLSMDALLDPDTHLAWVAGAQWAALLSDEVRFAVFLVNCMQFK